MADDYSKWFRQRLVPRKRRGITADFLRGLSVVGLARKYCRTRAQIERTLRRAIF